MNREIPESRQKASLSKSAKQMQDIINMLSELSETSLNYMVEITQEVAKGNNDVVQIMRDIGVDESTISDYQSRIAALN